MIRRFWNHKRLFTWLTCIVLVCSLVLTSCTTSTPVNTPQEITDTLPELKFGTHGTVMIGPGQAKGFIINDAGPIISANAYIEFKNNVPYSVDVYVVSEVYPGYIPYVNSFEDIIKSGFTRTTSKSEKWPLGMPFKNNPYYVWFVNNTSNTDFEVEYIYDWEYPGTKEGLHIE